MFYYKRVYTYVLIICLLTLESKLTRESRPKPDEIDPDCPDGYYLLTDTERLDALDFAKKSIKLIKK